MKKTLAIVLALACVFGMMSCTGKGPSLAAFKTAVANTNPATLEIDTKLETAMGDLAGEYVVTYAEDGSATIDYSYEMFNELGANVTELKKVEQGTIEINANGEYSGALSGTLSGVGEYKLNLDKGKMVDVTVNGNVLEAGIKAANTKAVLGVEIDADVTMTLTKGTDGIVSLVLTYSVEVVVGDETVSCPATITCAYQQAAAAE